jgi:hypothetical protein
MGVPSIKVLQREGEQIAREICRRTPRPLCRAEAPDLLVVSPGFVRAGGIPDGRAEILLLPGFTETCRVRSRCAVTYGLSGRDTLTLSSLAPRRRVLALQREILTVSGLILERQEVTVRDSMEPEALLAVYGALLLLGEKL